MQNRRRRWVSDGGDQRPAWPLLEVPGLSGEVVDLLVSPICCRQVVYAEWVKASCRFGQLSQALGHRREGKTAVVVARRMDESLLGAVLP